MPDQHQRLELLEDDLMDKRRTLVRSFPSGVIPIGRR
jgi:hypothetical protein